LKKEEEKEMKREEEEKGMVGGMTSCEYSTYG